MNILKTSSKFFICLAILAPIIVASGLYFPFITGKALFFRAMVEAALFLYLLYLIFLESRARREELDGIKNTIKHPVFMAAAAFTAIFVLSSLVSPNPSLSFWSNFERADGAFQMLHYFTFFALLAILFVSKKDWLGVFKFNLIAASVVAIYAVGQFLVFRGLINLDFIIGALERSGGTLGNPAYLGGYSLLAIFSGIFLFSRELKRFNKFLIIIGLIMLAGAILVSNTRGTILAATTGAILLLGYFAFVFWKTKPITCNIPLIALAALIIFVSFFIYTSGSDFWRHVPGLNRLTPEILSDAGFYTRAWTWGSAAAGIIEKPVLGWGVENFSLAFDKYYNANHYGLETWYDRAHNIFLDYAISGGLFLLAAYLAIFAAAIRIAWKTSEIWAKIAAVWLVMYLIQGIVLFDTLPIYIQMFILLAFFVGQTRIDTNMNANQHKKIGDNRAMQLTATVILATLFSASFYYTLYLPYKKNTGIIQAIISSRADPINAIRYFKSSLNFYSPIGRQENIEASISFWNDALANAASQKQTVSFENAKIISEFISETFETNESLFSSTRPKFLLGIIHMRLALMTNGQEFLDKAKEYCSEGNETAPTRIEFLGCLQTIAKFEKNKEKQEQLSAKMAFLRPDLFKSDGPIGN
ncbi:MAG: hypothetical protein UX23_C0005G0016 [Parcubacteria group bacterium GW2011_GWB1_45_9]|nr:MAG: hypothetical protein UX23_C0005G0016 [Parcubacteria group bacterium GW2011_GWB1_45_9]